MYNLGIHYIYHIVFNWNLPILNWEVTQMASYDYKSGKERIESILDNKLTVIEQDDVA